MASGGGQAVAVDGAIQVAGDVANPRGGLLSPAAALGGGGEVATKGLEVVRKSGLGVQGQAQIQNEDFGELKVVQKSLQYLVDNRYKVHPLRKRSTSEVEVLVLAHPDSLHLLKLFPYTVVIYTTFKTIGYSMVEIFGITCTREPFNVACAFTLREEVLHCSFIMKTLKKLFEDVGAKPTVIITDRELPLMKAIRIHFKDDVKHLFCWLHIIRNIEAYATPILKDKTIVKEFSDQCWALFNSTSEKIFEVRLSILKKSWKNGLVPYIMKTWLTPYKENIVRVWTDRHLHFFTRTPNRIEGMHYVIKNIMKSVRGEFNTFVASEIHNAIEGQIGQVKGSLEKSRTKIPTFFDDVPPEIRMLFSRLFYMVSEQCLRMLVNLYELIVNDDYTDDCEDYWMRDCFGLPCVHKIENAIVTRTPILPSEIHHFWKQVVLDGVESDVHTDDKVSMYVPMVQQKIMIEMFEKNQLNMDQIFQITELFNDAENPQTEIVPNRTTVSTKNSPKRDPSSSERKMAEQKENEEKKNCIGLPQASSGSRGSDSEFNEQPMIWKGVDFGIQNLDFFWFTYIKRAVDVASDGHCGYRTLSVLMGYQEDEYPLVRKKIAEELLGNKDVYTAIPCRSCTFEELNSRVNYVSSPCIEEYWLEMPFIGLVFSTVYQVALVLLTWDSPCLCSPMKVPAESTGPPTKILTMALVGARDHFIPVWLIDNNVPLPPPSKYWQKFHHQSVDGWDSQFETNIEIFRGYRRRHNRPPL